MMEGGRWTQEFERMSSVRVALMRFNFEEDLKMIFALVWALSYSVLT